MMHDDNFRAPSSDASWLLLASSDIGCVRRSRCCGMIRIEIDRLQLRLKASELDRLAALLREMERVESERAIGAPRRSSMVSLVVVPGLSLRLSYREIMELRSLIDDARSKLLRQRSHPWPTEFLN